MRSPEKPPGYARGRGAWVWPVLLAAMIFLVSSRSRLNNLGLDFDGVDKCAHFTVYGCLAILTCRLKPGWSFALLSIALASLYGVSDEWHQSFVPGRDVEVGDWVADTLGAVTAVVLYTGSTRFRRLLETPAFRRRKSTPKAIPLESRP